MHLSAIHHMAIIVSDYQASKDFYVNKLGFSIIRENYRPETSAYTPSAISFLKLSTTNALSSL